MGNLGIYAKTQIIDQQASIPIANSRMGISVNRTGINMEKTYVIQQQRIKNANRCPLK